MFATVLRLIQPLGTTGGVADKFMLSIRARISEDYAYGAGRGAGGVDPVQRMAEYLRH